MSLSLWPCPKSTLILSCRFQRLAIHYFVKLLSDVRIDVPLIQGPDDQFSEYRELGGKPILYGGTLFFTSTIPHISSLYFAEWEKFRSKGIGLKRRAIRRHGEEGV